jgi:diguanylate cyclase (GGDEF)-like protein/PAS domain S-box-containing protein
MSDMSAVRRAALAVFAGTAAFLAGLMLLRGQREPLWVFSGAVVVLAAALFSAAGFYRGAKSTGRLRHGWWLLAASGACFSIGQTMWTILQLTGDGTVGFPSYPEIFFLAELPLAGAGVLRFAGQSSAVTSRVRMVVDSLLVAATLLFVTWTLVIGPIYRAGATASVTSQVVGLAYPALHVAIVVLVVFVVARNGGRVGPDLALIGAGLVLLAAGYGGFAWLAATRGYHTGSLIDAAWMLAFGLMTLGALAPSRPSAGASSRAGGLVRIAGPYLLALLAMSVALVDVLRVGRLGRVQLWTGAAAIVLLAVRHLMSMLENAALNRQLEARVLERTHDLAVSEERYRFLVDSVHDVIFQADVEDRATFLNRAWEDVTGYPVPESLGRPLLDFIHPDARLQYARDVARAVADEHGQLPPLTVRLLARDGRVRVLETTATLILGDDGIPRGVTGLQRDVTDRIEAEQALRDSEERWRLLLESSGDGIYGLDLDGRCTFVNAAAVAMLGTTVEAMLGRHVHSLVHHTRPDGTPFPVEECEIRRSFTDGIPGRVDKDILWRPDGTSFPVDYSAQPIVQDGAVTGAVVTFVDITARLAAQREIEHRAVHDALTGLPNRTLVLDRLAQAARATQRSTRLAALLIMDLDRFKDINDTFGHPVGDRVLEQVALRMTGPGLLRAEDTVGRLGGDEFAVVLPSISSPDEAMAVAEKIAAAISRPIRVDGNAFKVASSIGIVIAPLHGTDPTVLVQRADVAMYIAKASGGTAAHYTSEDDAARVARLQLVDEVRAAIGDNDLYVHYQPIVDLRTGRVTQLEALCRWHSDTLGAVPPDVFVPLCEQAGLIMPMTVLVVGQVLRQSRLWRSEGIDVPIAVNISAQTLHDPQLMSLIESWYAGPEQPGPLEIEITESAVMTDPASAIRVLERLVARGVRVAIDDFGTGYSSLAQLKRLPVHSVKIDRTFVQEMGSDRRDASIVRSVIQLGHTLDLKVCAEGVESLDSARQLQRLGCDYAQGWHFGRPAPAADITRLLVDAVDDPAATHLPQA